MSPRNAQAQLAALLLFALLFAPACTEQASAEPRAVHSVVLLCLDTVRADHLGTYGYKTHPTTPTLDALAASGTVFADVVATSGWTKPSVPSYLTGTPPAMHGVYEGSARRRGELTSDVLGDEAETLAERFAAEGYATAAFVRNAQLAPGSGIEQGFDLYVDEAGDAARIVDQALLWLSQNSDRPFFLYLHILDVHWPYHVPDEAAERFADAGVLERFRSEDWKQLRDTINDADVPLGDAQRNELLALYDGALAYTDHQIGRLLKALDLRGLRDNTIISVVSDHGEEFMEHGRIGHGHGLFETLTAVPWIVAGPDVPIQRVESPVSLLDLTPTLMAAAGLESAGRVDSPIETVDRLGAPRRKGLLFSEHKGPGIYMQSLRHGLTKLVRTLRARAPHDSNSDPALAHLARGGRWEAELERTSSGGFRASQLKLRADDEGDPIELKGTLLELEGDALQLASWKALLGADTRYAGTLSKRSDLRVGETLKLSGPFENEVFRVQRAKGYGVSLSEPPEIRAALQLLESEGRSGLTRIGSMLISYDAGTRFKGVPDRAPAALLERGEIAEFHERGVLAMVREGYPVELRLFDLLADPRELKPEVIVLDNSTALPKRLQRLSDELDALGQQLAQHRSWGSTDRTLNDDTISALRELGYVR